MNRCEWANKEPDIAYHDHEWGVPEHDDTKLFEMLVLEGAQAGLSWTTVLKKREGYRKAFAGFNPKKVAAFTEKDVEKLLENPQIIRNKLKVRSAITNAQRFLEVQEEFGSFSTYIWGFVDNKPLVNTFASVAAIPAKTALSDAISKDLKKRGFSFVGSTIIYAYMQAIGIVDDHVTSCFRRQA